MIEISKKYLKKKVFVRQGVPRSTLDVSANIMPNTTIKDYYLEPDFPISNLSIVSQEQFMAELDPRSHIINNHAIYPDKIQYEMDDEGNAVVAGYNPVSRVTVAMQKFIAQRQALHMFGNPVVLKQSTRIKKLDFDLFNEFWRFSDLDSDILECCQSVKKTGDGAIYFYQDEDSNLKTKTFSYLNQDILIPTFVGDRLEAFVRKYRSVHDDVIKDHYDFFTEDYIQTYVKGGEGEFQPVSERKYHTLGIVPIAYYREDDVAWGCVQPNIDYIEKILSQNRDSSEYFAYGILFIKGEDVSVLPNKGSQGKVIAAEDSSSDAKLIEQKDVSPTLKFEYEEYRKTIYEQTGTVVIDPKDFKGGDVSGATIRNYYDPAIQQAMNSIPTVKPFLNQVKDIMTRMFNAFNNKAIGYSDIKINLDIYVPRNLSEEIMLLNQSVSQKTLSMQTASEKNKFANTDEYERLTREIESSMVQENKPPIVEQ